MPGICPFKLALEPAYRANPYPLYAAMPPLPTRIDGERYVVRTTSRSCPCCMTRG
jgi:hypothetical protein